MKVIFLWIAIEHTARTKKVNLTVESMIGRQREALIQSGPYSILNYLSTNYMKQRSMPTYLWIGSALNYYQKRLIIWSLF